MNEVPCPQCGRLLWPCGALASGLTEYPVYQCPACTALVMVYGVPCEVNYTFCLDDDGEPVDPAEIPGADGQAG